MLIFLVIFLYGPAKNMNTLLTLMMKCKILKSGNMRRKII